MPDPQKPLYNLENRLCALGELDNSFVIGIFDCCREAYDESKFPSIATRGIGGVGNEEKEVLTGKGQNVFLIFGCP